MKHWCLPGPPSKAASGRVFEGRSVVVAQPGSAFSEMAPPSHSSAAALEEAGQGADKGNCCPQSAAGETPARQNGKQAPICHLSHHLPLALMELGTCTHVHSAMAMPLPRHRNWVTQLPR